MAVQNIIHVFIDGVNRTSNVVVPVKFGNFLDERLDECYLSLRGIKKEYFQPLTPVEIRIVNETYWGGEAQVTGEIYGGTVNKVTEQKNEETKYYIIADDSSTETLVGKNVYNHELCLIEVTKIAECYVVDTLTFTNDLGRAYTANDAYAEPVWE